MTGKPKQDAIKKNAIKAMKRKRNQSLLYLKNYGLSNVFLL